MKTYLKVMTLMMILILLITGCAEKDMDQTSTKKPSKIEATIEGSTANERTESIQISGHEINLDQYNDDTGAKVIFVYDDNNILYKFIVFGTTDYNEYGDDIVAASLSALSINTINSLLQLTDIDVIYDDKEVDGKPYLECYINELHNKKQIEEFDLLIQSFKLGVESIEESYGSQYVEVIELD